MRIPGCSAWLLVVTAACRWGFQNQPLDGSGDAGTDAPPTLEADICTTHWCWERPPPPEQRSMRAVFGSSATNVWAVGDGGLIRRWDGSSWSVVASPTTEGLSAVDVVSPTDVTVAAQGGVLWHYDGATWTAEQLATFNTVAALWRSLVDNKLWAAGDLGTISVDGAMGTSFPDGEAATALDGLDPSNVWFAGKFNGIGHFDGSFWTIALLGDFPTALLTRPTYAFVGGNDLWQCSAPSVCSHIAAGVYIRDFFRISDSDIWAVGSLGHVEHFDSATWQPVAVPVTANLTSVWASASNDVWAVGEDGALLHYDGASWTSMGNEQPIEPSWFALWVGADDDRWLADTTGVLWHSDGGAPVTFPVPSGTVIGDEIEGNAGNDVYALDRGNLGVIHFDGTAWTLDPSLTTLSADGGGLATDGTETIASNLTGTVYDKPTGGSFSMAFNRAGVEWHGLCLGPNGDALAMGRFGSAEVRKSGTWSMTSPSTSRFMVACDYGDSTAWAVGGDTVTSLLPGGGWTGIGFLAGTTQSLQDVLAVSDTEVYLVGAAGLVVASHDGASWGLETSPLATDIGKLARSSSGTIYAAGRFPGMLRRR